MTKNSSTCCSSMKPMRILFVVGLLALLVSTEFTAAYGRSLRSTTKDNVGAHDNIPVPVGVPPITAAASGIRTSLKSLAFKLASGPSKRGPGH